MITRKVCLLGAFGVGKTSLVRRFVRQSFSEKYLTTVGVKVDTKVIALSGEAPLKLVIWDIAGAATDVDTPRAGYLSGAAGYLLVMDGTRADTVETAGRLKTAIDALSGEIPFVALINKSDLIADWRIDAAAVAKTGWPVLETSARDGSNVERAFSLLAGKLLVKA